MVSPMARVRLHLMRTVPAIQGRVLHMRQIARRLREVFPDELDEIAAGALVGALIGAITGALLAILDAPDSTDALTGFWDYLRRIER